MEPDVRSSIPRRRGIALAGIIAALAALLGPGLMADRPASVASPPGAGAATQSGTSTASAAAGTPTADGSDVGSPRPSATPEQWTDLALAPFATRAELVPAVSDRSGVAPRSAFRLTSRTATSAAELASDIDVSPPTAVSVERTSDAQTVFIRPAEALEEGKTYRFTIHGADGALVGSWTFRTAMPLEIATTLPGDGASSVPLDTGIELTFNQDGPVDVARQFAIEPRVEGTFEQHGRTVVFVPHQRLAPATLYTVRIAAGVALEGSDSRLEKPVAFRFETVGPGTTPSSRILFERAVVESSPSERPVLAVLHASSSGSLDTTRFGVDVYAIPSLWTAIDAVSGLTQAPSWATWSSSGLVDTEHLRRVLRFDTRPTRVGDSGDGWFRFPTKLERGWYVVVVPQAGRDAQAVLQVTDVATYALVTPTRSLTWVNDIATAGPLAGARVLLGSTLLGRTGADGLVQFDTPAGVLSAASHDSSLSSVPSGAAVSGVLTIRAEDGRTAIVPVGLADDGNAYTQPASTWNGSDADAYWHVMATDRGIVRPTDRINVWGLIRDRDAGTVPGSVELRLTAAPYSSYAGTPAIATVDVKPDATGAFATSIPFTDLPYGSYGVELYVGTTWIDMRSFAVDVIRKPAYQVSVDVERHVVAAGDTVDLTAHVSFFDGTPAPSIPLEVQLFGERPVTTDRAGIATATASASFSSWASGRDEAWVNVQSTRPEEAAISGETSIIVFQSTRWVEGEATLVGGRAVVNGSVNVVDFSRLERMPAGELWSADPKGKPIEGATVKATLIELVPVLKRHTTYYDFIQKRIVSSDEYDIREETVGTRTVTAAVDGSFELGFPLGTDHDYVVLLRTTDAAGRTMTARVDVSRGHAALPLTRPYLETPGTCGPAGGSFAIGEAMSLTMRQPDGTSPAGGVNRYLFATGQRGLRTVVVQGSPTYQAMFTSADAPNIDVVAVRFTGSAYQPVPTKYGVFVETETQAIAVSLETDRSRYAPGDEVQLSVRTTDWLGRPVPATVALRAVDEKLYAIGGASDVDVLGELYAPVASALTWSYASHPLPSPPGPGGCGDTGGGGDGRSDFRDWLLFRLVTTGTNGTARASFRLSDDLTSWHLSVAAMTADLRAGEADMLVPVGLPFWVEPTLAPEYLASDRPTLGLRAYGSAIHAGDPVTFTVRSPTLGMAPQTVRGTAFTDVQVPLPRLTPGRHTVTVVGRATGTGAGGLSDTITRTFAVVTSRLSRVVTSYTVLEGTVRPAGGDGLTTYVFTDAGAGRYLPTLDALAWDAGARVDRAAAAAIARRMLVDRFLVASDALPPASFDREGYQRSEGIALLPYSGPDLALTVRLALLAPGEFDTHLLESTFSMVGQDAEATSEQRNLALAGEAAIGRPVLDEIRAAIADPSTTIRERLYLALGALALGDEATARSVEQALLSGAGERLGRWARLRVGDRIDDTIEATALAAVLAAGLGDPLAADLEAYAAANPARDDIYSLEEIAFIERSIDRLPSAQARFAFTVDGKRRVVDLGVGGSYSLTLTAVQRATLSVERLDGAVGVAASWEAPMDVNAVSRDSDMTLTREVVPPGEIAAGTVLEVTLRLGFTGMATGECRQVTDLVPSGLAPVGRLESWKLEDSEPFAYVSPYAIVGQRVMFCAGPSSRPMHYLARVVTPGTYAWEQAVAQSAGRGDRVAVTPATTITIR